MRGPSNPLRLFSEARVSLRRIRIKQPRLRLTLIPTYSFPSCRIYILSYLLSNSYDIVCATRTHSNKHTVLCDMVFCIRRAVYCAPTGFSSRAEFYASFWQRVIDRQRRRRIRRWSLRRKRLPPPERALRRHR